jgi:hypothetical protein
MVSAHSAHAATPGHQCGRASRPARITAMILGARSPPPAPPSLTRDSQHPGHTQSDRPSSRQRYGRRRFRRIRLRREVPLRWRQASTGPALTNISRTLTRRSDRHIRWSAGAAAPRSAGAAARRAERPTGVSGTIRPDPGSRWRHPLSTRVGWWVAAGGAAGPALEGRTMSPDRSGAGGVKGRRRRSRRDA